MTLAFLLRVDFFSFLFFFFFSSLDTLHACSDFRSWPSKALDMTSGLVRQASQDRVDFRRNVQMTEFENSINSKTLTDQPTGLGARYFFF